MKRARTIVPPLAADVTSDYFTSTRGSQRLLLHQWILPVAFGADGDDPPDRRIPRSRRDVRLGRARRARLLPSEGAARHRDALAGIDADAAHRTGRARAAASLRPPPCATPAALPLRLAL